MGDALWGREDALEDAARRIRVGEREDLPDHALQHDNLLPVVQQMAACGAFPEPYDLDSFYETVGGPIKQSPNILLSPRCWQAGAGAECMMHLWNAMWVRVLLEEIVH